jgi:tetratricopeptide (TPR) repeat protein
MYVNVKMLVAVIRNYRSIVLGSFILVTALTYFISRMYPFYSEPVLLYPVFPGGLFIVYLSFRGYRISRVKKMERLLYDDCDPGAFLNVYGEFISMLGDADINTGIAAYDIKLGFETYWLTLCEGVAASGNYCGALKILGQIAGRVPEKHENAFNVMCRYQLCLVNLELGNTGQKYKRHHLRAQYALNLAKGIYDYAEKAFIELYETSQNNFERVSYKYSLANIHLHSGDMARAKEALEYVIARGNKLHIVEEAKQRLERLK